MSEPTAKSVAKELDRRQVRRKLLLLAVLVAALIAAITYLTCGKGFGLGGKGPGKGTGSGSGTAVVVDAATHCAVRVSATGLTVDGNAATREAVVDVCSKTKRAVVTVTGDARQGDWDQLRNALESAEIAIEK